MFGAVPKIGDTVTLNSGGHLMTVVSVDDTSATCEWSVKNDIKSKSFSLGTLKKGVTPMTLEEMVIASHKKAD